MCMRLHLQALLKMLISGGRSERVAVPTCVIKYGFKQAMGTIIMKLRVYFRFRNVINYTDIRSRIPH